MCTYALCCCCQGKLEIPQGGRDWERSGRGKIGESQRRLHKGRTPARRDNSFMNSSAAAAATLLDLLLWRWGKNAAEEGGDVRARQRATDRDRRRGTAQRVASREMNDNHFSLRASSITLLSPSSRPASVLVLKVCHPASQPDCQLTATSSVQRRVVVSECVSYLPSPYILPHPN